MLFFRKYFNLWEYLGYHTWDDAGQTCEFIVCWPRPKTAGESCHFILCQGRCNLQSCIYSLWHTVHQVFFEIGKSECMNFIAHCWKFFFFNFTVTIHFLFFFSMQVKSIYWNQILIFFVLIWLFYQVQGSSYRCLNTN